MKLQLLLPLWLLIPYTVLALGVVGRQVWKLRKRRKQYRYLSKQFVRRSAILLLPILVALGPSVQGGTSSPGVANLDVVFAVDTTPSMGALDYAGTRQRMEGAKADIKALAASLQGAHFEIITFDSGASVILPLTTDTTAFSTAVDGMTPQINSYSQGSTIDKPISLITQELKASSTAYPDHYRLLFYLGDGEQTADAPVKPFSSIARYLSGGGVLGYGTAKGAQMVKYTGIDSTSNAASYITTIDQNTGKLTPAVSKTDGAALQKIAKELKVTYQDRNQGGSVSGLYQASQAALAVDKSQRVVHYLNLYWLIGIPLAGLLFWEWQILITRLLDMREHHPQAPKPKKARRA